MKKWPYSLELLVPAGPFAKVLQTVDKLAIAGTLCFIGSRTARTASMDDIAVAHVVGWIRKTFIQSAA